MKRLRRQDLKSKLKIGVFYNPETDKLSIWPVLGIYSMLKPLSPWILVGEL